MNAAHTNVRGRRHNGDSNNQNPEVVKQVINNYVPAIPSEHWSAIGGFVRETVSSYPLRTVQMTRQYLVAATNFSLWAWQTLGLELEADMIFRHHNVARFIDRVMAGYSDNYRYRTAQRLNLLVSHGAGSKPERLAGPERSAVHPYSAPEFIEFRSSAARRSTEARRMNAHTLLALGAGAGLRTEEIAMARIGDVVRDGDDILIRVQGRHNRQVPVLTEWHGALLFGIGERDATEWLFSGYRIPQYPARVIHQFGIDDPAESTPETSRLRGGWIVGLLRRGVPVNVVLQLSGLTKTVSLDRYVQALPPRDPRDFRDLITGREAHV